MMSRDAPLATAPARRLEHSTVDLIDQVIHAAQVVVVVRVSVGIGNVSNQVAGNSRWVAPHWEWRVAAAIFHDAAGHSFTGDVRCASGSGWQPLIPSDGGTCFHLGAPGVTAGGTGGLSLRFFSMSPTA